MKERMGISGLGQSIITQNYMGLGLRDLETLITVMGEKIWWKWNWG